MEKVTPAPPAISPAVQQAIATQIERGRALFADKCAECHGATAQGTDDGPALVGQDVLPREPRAGSKRTATFVTAADVLAFATQNMPADDPGSLAPDDYAAVLAFAVSANAIKLDKPLDATTAQAITLRP
jgi:cytochrome c